MEIVKLGFRRAGRAAEERAKRFREHRTGSGEIEEAEVEQEISGRRHTRKPLHFLDEARLAIRGEPHDLVLAVIDLEAEIGGDRAVEKAERVWESDLLEEREMRALASTVGGRSPFS